MAKLTKETISFKDAMDNLSALSTIDLNAPGPIGVLGRHRIVTDEEEFPQMEIRWLSGEGSEALLEVMDATFRAIHDHLIKLVDNPEMDWTTERGRKAVASMVSLAGESATRLQKYLEICLGKPMTGITEREELRSLMHFYERKFSEQIEGDQPHEVNDTQMKNIEEVRRDQEYELFYIRKEDGSPYYNPDLLRHMRLICDVESEGDSFEDDPLLQIRSMVDRDLQATAGQILGNCHGLIGDLYKVFKRISNNDLAAMLSSAITALFLAANPRNLLQNSAHKTCQEYFQDFHRFLKTALRTHEYQKLIAYVPEKSDKIAHLLLNLAHSLCDELFCRKGGVKLESIGLIHRTARKGAEQPKAELKRGTTFWTQFLIDDDNYRSRLAKFPSGPLFKILDLVRLEEEEPAPFDSIAQGNYPMHLFGIESSGKEIDVLHMPCPTRQLYINKVEILDEMRGMLRCYNSDNQPRKHLMINLQDRNSWRESIRSKAIEDMQKNAEYSQSLTVVTIPKNTEFYMQTSEYLNMNSADEFIARVVKQFETPEECGFYFPPVFKTHELVRFAETATALIHRHFFQKKNVLTRRGREDFIEIFTQFLVLKIIDQVHPTSLSFTCKDAIDTGAAEGASFFAFLKLLSSGFEEKADLDIFRWLVYQPALFVRERAIDAERLNRTLTSLEKIDTGVKEHKKVILEEFSTLYRTNFFKSLKVTF